MKDKSYQFLEDLCSSMKEEDVIVYYKGQFDDKILFDIGDKIRKRFVEQPKIGKKLFSIFMELAQNISLYSSEKNDLDNNSGWGIGIIAIYETRSFYELTTGNVVRNNALGPILEKCKEINALGRDGLRAMKREFRSAERPTDHKGGNIGLIHVALKSDMPLQIDVKTIDDDHSFFTISVNILK